VIDWHSVHGRGGRMDTRDELLKLSHQELLQLFLILEMKNHTFEKDLYDAIIMLRSQRR
jgi:hypothetical protein